MTRFWLNGCFQLCQSVRPTHTSRVPIRMTSSRIFLFLFACTMVACAGNDAPRVAQDSVAIDSTAGSVSAGVVVDTAKPIQDTAKADSGPPRPRDTSFAANITAWGERARKEGKWPVKGPAPLPGSLLPNNRIIAYYGNPLSKRSDFGMTIEAQI